jgi:transcriptional regulator with XRE-family HTH domain
MIQDNKGAILKEFRKAAGLNQLQLANLSSKERSTISGWETGRANMSLPDILVCIKVLKLSDKDSRRLLGYEATNQREIDVIDSYKKVISYFRGALLHTFDHFFSNCTVISEDEYTLFEELTEEQKEIITKKLGIELTKQAYMIFISQERLALFQEEYYNAFCLFLRHNPIAITILHFGLLGEEYEGLFNRWLNDKDKNKRLKNLSDKVEGMYARMSSEEYSAMSLELNEELKTEKNNFSQIINSEKLFFKGDIFRNSIIH